MTASVSCRGRYDGRFSWVSIVCPDLYQKALSISLKTAPSCLPCCFVRLSVAIVIARRHDIGRVSYGFTKYQSSWVEQTGSAIGAIEGFLSEHGLVLDLPVQSLASKKEACEMLSGYGLSEESMEPLCHCAEIGTRKNAPTTHIMSDIGLLLPICRTFVAKEAAFPPKAQEG